MGSESPSTMILKHLIKSHCSTYDDLKKLLKNANLNPDSVYEYVKYLKRKNYVHTLKMSRRKIVCINESIRREIELLLKLLSK